MPQPLFHSVASRMLRLCFAVVTPVAFAGMDRAIYISPIPDSPLTAIVEVDQTTIERDGTRVTVKFIETIARDSHGRIYRDAWRRDAAGKPMIVTVDLYDPATATYTIVDPLFKTYWAGRLDRQPAIMGDGFFYDPRDDGTPKSQFQHGEDLGLQDLDGLPVHHVREIDPVTDSAEKKVVKREYWYSDDLRMNLASRLNDPQAEIQTMTVTQLARKEPDAAIYKTPPGYRRVDTLSQLHTSPQ
jgi:hypothetical protein